MMKRIKFHLGTEEAIDVVRKYDELLTAKDWEGVRAFADTATVIIIAASKLALQMLEMAGQRFKLRCK